MSATEDMQRSTAITEVGSIKGGTAQAESSVTQFSEFTLFTNKEYSIETPASSIMYYLEY